MEKPFKRLRRGTLISITLAAGRNVNVNNLVQTIVQRRETINSILTANNQEQSTNIVTAKANPLNGTNSIKIPSAASTNNSSSIPRVVKNGKLDLKTQHMNCYQYLDAGKARQGLL